jgi:hypothetical protein
MYTTTTTVEKVGAIDIVKRQNLGNASYEFLLEENGQTLYEETKRGREPHLYFSLSFARTNALQLASKTN